MKGGGKRVGAVGPSPSPSPCSTQTWDRAGVVESGLGLLRGHEDVGARRTPLVTYLQGWGLAFQPPPGCERGPGVVRRGGGPAVMAQLDRPDLVSKHLGSLSF